MASSFHTAPSTAPSPSERPPLKGKTSSPWAWPRLVDKPKTASSTAVAQQQIPHQTPQQAPHQTPQQAPHQTPHQTPAIDSDRILGSGIPDSAAECDPESAARHSAPSDETPEDAADQIASESAEHERNAARELVDSILEQVEKSGEYLLKLVHDPSEELNNETVVPLAQDQPEHHKELYGSLDEDEPRTQQPPTCPLPTHSSAFEAPYLPLTVSESHPQAAETNPSIRITRATEDLDPNSTFSLRLTPPPMHIWKNTVTPGSMVPARETANPPPRVSPVKVVSEPRPSLSDTHSDTHGVAILTSPLPEIRAPPANVNIVAPTKNTPHKLDRVGTLPVVSIPKKRKLAVRKARSKMLRTPVLNIMLGRDLGRQVKPALKVASKGAPVGNLKDSPRSKKPDTGTVSKVEEGTGHGRAASIELQTS